MDAPPPPGGALKRVIFTIDLLHGPRRCRKHRALELGLDFGAGAVAVIAAPYVGDWVYVVASVIVIGSLPVLALNVARVARREWKEAQRCKRRGDR
jgi:hypothetical protein